MFDFPYFKIVVFFFEKKNSLFKILTIKHVKHKIQLYARVHSWEVSKYFFIMDGIFVLISPLKMWPTLDCYLLASTQLLEVHSSHCWVAGTPERNQRINLFNYKKAKWKKTKRNSIIIRDTKRDHICGRQLDCTRIWKNNNAKIKWNWCDIALTDRSKCYSLWTRDFLFFKFLRVCLVWVKNERKIFVNKLHV